MKKLLFIALIIGALGLSKSYSQQIVANPTLESLTVTLNELIGTQTTIQKMKEQARWATDFAEGLKTAKQIQKIIEQIACERGIFRSYLKISAPNSCLGNLNLQMVLIDLNLSFDWYVVAMGKVVGMAANKRLETLKDALEYLKSGHNAMQDYMAMVDVNMMEEVKRTINEEDYGRGMSVNAYHTNMYDSKKETE